MKTLEEKREYNRLAMRKYRSTEKGKADRYYRRKLYYSKTKHLSIGKAVRWTEDEVDVLIHFKGTDEELAYALHRSVASIQAKRFRLNSMGE